MGKQILLLPGPSDSNAVLAHPHSVNPWRLPTLSNVVMLLIARNATRQPEFSLRLALGAGRGELFRQLLMESLLLVALGGGLAWLFAAFATKALGAWAQIESSLAPDSTVLFFTLSILILAALLFGLAPLRIAPLSRAGTGIKDIRDNVQYRCRQDRHRQDYCRPANGAVRGAARRRRAAHSHLA
jgi:hypothetical protein